MKVSCFRHTYSRNKPNWPLDFINDLKVVGKSPDVDNEHRKTRQQGLQDVAGHTYHTDRRYCLLPESIRLLTCRQKWCLAAIFQMSSRLVVASSSHKTWTRSRSPRRAYRAESRGKRKAMTSPAPPASPRDAIHRRWRHAELREQ